MKKVILLVIAIIPGSYSFAQKQTFDVISFAFPKGWQQQQNEAGLQLSVADKKSGAYAIAVITKATASAASAGENFNSDWNRLVKTSVQVSGESSMTAPAKENGWDVISGSTNYTDGANTGKATLLTATGGGKTMSVVLMTNTQQYQKELLAFINSLQLSKVTQHTIANTANSTLANKIWEAKSYEKNGAAYGATSGSYTGGFWYYQYKFNADGTYTFVYHAASALATNPVNLLQYETGNYTVNGNQLTLTPQKGTDEEWSVGKINNGMSAEHIRGVLETRIKRLKTTARKLEKITYSFTVEFWQGNNANALCLKHSQNIVREGSPGQNNQSCFFETAAAKTENYNALFK